MNDYFYFTVTRAGGKHGFLMYEQGKVYKVARKHLSELFFLEYVSYIKEISPVEAIAAGEVIDVLDAAKDAEQSHKERDDAI